MRCIVALLQLLPESTLEQNKEKGVYACRTAKEMGADIALFPEMWSIGYESGKMNNEHALDKTSSFVQRFCSLAQELDMAIVITYLAQGTSKPRNMVAVIDRYGTIVLEYAKIHICSFDEGTEIALEPGERFEVVDLSLPSGTIRIGCMICFDREFPESARVLAVQGAELIFVPNACDIKHDKAIGDVRFCQLRARAFENMVGIALANYPRPKNDGHSVAFMPDGVSLVTAGEDEQICLASFDIDALRAWRAKEVWGTHHTQFKITYDK